MKIGHRIIETNLETRTGICQKCGPVAIIRGGTKNGEQLWHCQLSHRPSATKQTRGWVHRMLSLDLETLTGVCSNCGSVGLRIQGKKADGSPKYRCENICEPIRKQPLLVRHYLSEIDKETRRATCEICGPTDVRPKRSVTGVVTWNCETNRRATSEQYRLARLAANPKEPRKKHRLTNVDPEARTADCKKCGPVKIHKGSVSKNGVRVWGCANATRDGNLKRDYGITQADYLVLYGTQDGHCLICANHFDALVIDHDHAREWTDGRAVIRGLLCTECNLGLGGAYDSIETLRSMIDYLDHTPIVFPEIEAKVKGKRVFVHRLTEINLELRTAVCAACGSTEIKRDGYLRNGDQAWRCVGSSRRAPVVRRNVSLKRFFGITNDQYDFLLNEQGGACKICRTFPDECDYLVVDHQHERGLPRKANSGTPDQIRGLLCQPCNAALGQFHDDPARIQSAIAYLQHHSPVQPNDPAALRDKPEVTLHAADLAQLTLEQFVDLPVDQLLATA